MTSLERPSEKSRKNIAKNVEKHIDPCYDKNTLKNLFFITVESCTCRFPPCNNRLLKEVRIWAFA